jgi:hypothetical protein
LKTLKIAYLHYHLKPGGVTTVIAHQVAAVSSSCETLVLSSQPPPYGRGIGTEVAPLPLLAYDHEIHQTFSPQQLARSINEAIHNKWPGGCDVLHVHNPTLAKNKQLLKALEILRDKGIAMFLQIHDFAEDGRPDAYCQDDYVANVHYGVINSRDYELLVQAGLKKEGLHRIANKILPFNRHRDTPLMEGEEELVLYPVRAIRRKNIGEALLLSLFIEKNHTIGITLPPNSPGDIASYRQWQTFIQQHHFSVKLELGLNHDFKQLQSKAAYFITTSLNEGFGFAFLEPWTGSKMVFGRNLPHVCQDFTAKGVKLDHLYHGLYVPMDAVEPKSIKSHDESFFSRWQSAVMHHADAFGCSLDPGTVNDAFLRLSTDGAIDFGVLDQTAQMHALENIKIDAYYRQRVIKLNPWLDCQSPFKSRIHQETINHNNAVVREHYGNHRYAKTLLKIYNAVTAESVTHDINKEILLNAFLDPLEFKMLKWKEI